MGDNVMDGLLESLGGLFGGRRQHPLGTGPSGAPTARYRTDAASTSLYAAEIAFRAEVVPRLLVGEEIRVFVAGIMAMDWAPWRPCSSWPVRVVLVPSTDYAWYANGVITLSSPADVSVVLHELAHHFAPFAPSSTRNFHGTTFMAAYLALIAKVMGPEEARVLAGHLAGNGKAGGPEGPPALRPDRAPASTP